MQRSQLMQPHNLKLFVHKKEDGKGYVLLFYLHKILDNKHLRGKIQMSELLEGKGWVERVRLQRSLRKLWNVLIYLLMITLIITMLSQLCACMCLNSQNYMCNHVMFILYQLYLNKTVKK